MIKRTLNITTELPEEESKLLDEISIPEVEFESDSLDRALEHIEKDIILRTLERNQWKKNQTASALKINRKTLFRKLKKYEIE